MGEQVKGGEPAPLPKSLQTIEIFNRYKLVFVACLATTVILHKTRPATWPRRFAFLGIGIAAHGTADFLRRHSDSLSRNMRLAMIKGEDPGRLTDYERWIHTYTYMDDSDSGRLARQAALEKLHARLSGSEGPGIILRYLERERIRDSQSTLGERIAFKWYNLWSSVDTRAAIDDVLSSYLTLVPMVPMGPHIPECDRRYFVSYTGSMLEYKLLASSHDLPSVLASDCSIYGGMYFPNLWAVYTAAFVGLGSLAYYLGYHVRRAQLSEGPLRYTNQDISPVLHMCWRDWAVTDGKWRKALAAKNVADRKDSSHVVPAKNS